MLFILYDYNMKKQQIFWATIAICCIFLWIGFYAGWATKSASNAPNSDGQNQCLKMYSLAKEYITDHYKIEPIEWIDPSHSTVWDIDIRYNPNIDGCYASTTVYYTDYINTVDGLKPNITRTEYIFSIWDSIDVIYRCDFQGDKSKDCRDDFRLKKEELKKSS